MESRYYFPMQNCVEAHGSSKSSYSSMGSMGVGPQKSVSSL